MRLLKEREELKQLRLSELRKEIAVGSEQADRGELVDGDEVFRRASAPRAPNARPTASEPVYPHAARGIRVDHPHAGTI